MAIEIPQTIPPLQELKESYKQKLNNILYKNLTIENIEYFGDEALNELISLIDEILKEYSTNKELQPNLNLSLHEQEDDAFNKLDLPNLQEILQKVIEVKTKIDYIKKYLYEGTNTINNELIPPESRTSNIISGSGEGLNQRIFIPRLLTLLYIIETDFNILIKDITITKGAITSNGMRKAPYLRVEIPNVNRTVYVCDEEGNASYIFDNSILEEVGITIEEIDASNKLLLKSIISKHPGVGIKIIQTKDWRTNISKLLSQPLPDKINEESEPTISEFGRRERKDLPDYNTFQNEVRSLCPEKGNIQKWYYEERKKHANWTSLPYIIYKDTGWVGWPELVGRENRLKKEFLTFETFQTEVRALYTGKGNVQEWYKNERLKHSNWYSNPHELYKNDGWIGWPELVGIRNRKKIDYPTFNTFQIEASSLYPGTGDIKTWYYEEKKNHPDWPSSPASIYKNDGWLGWPELVGRENRLKKEYLSFNDLQNETAHLYPGTGGIQEWYRAEQKKHPKWPTNPNIMYEDDGWVGWSQLIKKT